jgi:23S rRNA (uridine2552-2'-O)-methyltransferase
MSRRRNNPYARADARTRAAKARGFPARSVFKLEEIDRRFKLFATGQRVVDLGAAPGSWAKYASLRVGSRGRVLAVDLSPIEGGLGDNVTVIQGDAHVLDGEVFAEHGPFDVVLSDMAPSTSGSKFSDQARSFELFMRALNVALTHGKRGSHFVGKIFMSSDFNEARSAVAERYERVSVVRPSATRKTSSELFIVGLLQREGRSFEGGGTSGVALPPAEDPR